MMAANPAGADVCPADNELGLRWLRAFPGTKAQVAEVRRFVTCLLAEHPACEALITCVSELAANAVVHTASGRGGQFTVEVSCPRTGVARVSVTDAGGPTEPAAGAPVVEASDEDVDELPVCGLGLALVAATASRWGYHDTGSGRTVWAEASWPVALVASPGETGAARRDFPEHAAPSRFISLTPPVSSAPGGAAAGRAARRSR
ncbi:MAG TPA: ATP-binding protein [Streptosporangiaceae bacterium]|jgi:anti-sigma regulatory factor (Ser/Thr protein kinase)